jgi:hypothetical protein
MLSNRVGTFFMLVGGFAVFLAIVIGQAGGSSGKAFFFGLVAFLFGLWLWWRSPRPERQADARFRMVTRRRKKKEQRRSPDHPDTNGEP